MSGSARRSRRLLLVSDKDISISYHVLMPVIVKKAKETVTQCLRALQDPTISKMLRCNE